jgi:hypothetical protein
VARVPCLTTALATLPITALAAIGSATAETALARLVAGGWLGGVARAATFLFLQLGDTGG